MPLNQKKKTVMIEMKGFRPILSIAEALKGDKTRELFSGLENDDLREQCREVWKQSKKETTLKLR